MKIRKLTIDQRRDMAATMRLAAGMGISVRADFQMLDIVRAVRGHSFLPAQAAFRRDMRIAGARRQRDPKLSPLGRRWMRTISACLSARVIVKAHLRGASHRDALFPMKRAR